MLEKVAPEKTVKFANKPIKPWFNKYIRDQMNIVQKRDCVWRKYRQQHQWQAYSKERNMYNHLLMYHKKQVIFNQINGNRKNMKGPFQTINELIGNKA